MKRTRMLLLVPAAVIAAACGRKDTAAADAGLQSDLALASQSMPYTPQQLTSPAEMGLQYNPNTGQYQRVPTAPVQAAPVVRRVYRQPAATRTASYPSQRAPVYAPAEPVRHTRRDAAIGAVAGAVIGATTSRDKVKGGIIGAVAGGVLGGIIGHTVDVQKPY